MTFSQILAILNSFSRSKSKWYKTKKEYKKFALFKATDHSNFDKRCSDAQFLSFLFYYYCNFIGCFKAWTKIYNQGNHVLFEWRINLVVENSSKVQMPSPIINPKLLTQIMGWFGTTNGWKVLLKHLKEGGKLWNGLFTRGWTFLCVFLRAAITHHTVILQD